MKEVFKSLSQRLVQGFKVIVGTMSRLVSPRKAKGPPNPGWEYENIDEGLKQETLEIKPNLFNPEYQKIVDLLKELKDLKTAKRELEEKYDKFRRTLLGNLINRLDSLSQLIEKADSRTYEDFLEQIIVEKDSLKSLLKSYGISAIDFKKFSPDLHEPYPDVVIRNDLPDGTIVKVLKPGYLWDGEIFLRALVQISKRTDKTKTIQSQEIFDGKKKNK